MSKITKIGDFAKNGPENLQFRVVFESILRLGGKSADFPPKLKKFEDVRSGMPGYGGLSGFRWGELVGPARRGSSSQGTAAGVSGFQGGAQTRESGRGGAGLYIYRSATCDEKTHSKINSILDASRAPK